MTHSQLIIDDLSNIPKWFHRVLSVDPTIFYDRLCEKKGFSYFKRQNHVKSEWLFPKRNDGLCACGCGEVLTGRKRRWATDECRKYSNQVHAIISGDSQFIRRLLSCLYEEKCCVCGKYDTDFPTDYSKDTGWKWTDYCTKIHLEHTIPVHKGGGACWLGNYTFMCVDCHKEKTKRDRL